MTTVLEEKLFCLLLQRKSWSKRGASHHPAFMGNCPTISHTFSALSTQWVNHVLLQWVLPQESVLCLMWIKRIRKWGSSGFYVTQWWRTFWTVAFRILPNIRDGAPLQKQAIALTLISHWWAFSYSTWHLSSFLSVPCFAFICLYMNLFCTFVCLTFFKFINIFL